MFFLFLSLVEPKERGTKATVGGYSVYTYQYDPSDLTKEHRYRFKYITANSEIELGDTGYFHNVNGDEGQWSDDYQDGSFMYGSVTLRTTGRTAQHVKVFPGYTETDGNRYTFKTVGINHFGFTNYAFQTLEMPSSLRYVGNYTFWKCANLNNISFISLLEVIPKGCFSECTSLENAVIPSNIKRIEDFAFEKTKISNIIIPETVQKLGHSIFMGCSHLVSVSFPATISTIPDNMFKDSGLTTFPSGVSIESIGISSFENTKFTTLVIPENVITIGASCFKSCSVLTKISFPMSVRVIPDHVLDGCTLLANIEFRDNITSVGAYACANCPAFARINYCGQTLIQFDPTWHQNSRAGQIFIVQYFQGSLNTNDNSVSVSLGVNVFTKTQVAYHIFQHMIRAYPVLPGSGSAASVINNEGIEFVLNLNFDCVNCIGKGKLKEFHLCNSTGRQVSMNANAFSGCPNLEVLMLNDYLTSIGDNAVCNTKITRIDIPNSCQTIGSSAFENCTLLTIVNLGEGVTRIGSSAFKRTGITNIVIPESVTSMGPSAFEGCTNLISATFPSKTTSFPDMTFKNTGLTAYPDLPNIVTIGISTFENTKLTTVVIPEKVNYIGSSCFKACILLTKISFPMSLRVIPPYVLQGCTLLANIEFKDNITSVGEYAMANCPAFTQISYCGRTVIQFDPTWHQNSKSGTIRIIQYFQGTLNTQDSTVTVTTGVNVFTLNNVGYNILQFTINAYPTVKTDASLPSVVKNADINTALNYNVFCVNCIGKEKLKEFHICNSVDRSVSIDANAFNGCPNLESLTLGEFLTSIGNNAVSNTKITKIDIPNSCKTIGASAFEGCSLLAIVNLGEGITSIGNNAFKGTAVAELIIPSSCTSIGQSVFDGCESLLTVHIKGDITIGTNCFSGCIGLTSIAYCGTRDPGRVSFFSTPPPSVTIHTLPSASFDDFGGLSYEKDANVVSKDHFTMTVDDQNVTVVADETVRNGYDIRNGTLKDLLSTKVRCINCQYTTIRSLFFKGGFYKIETDTFKQMTELEYLYFGGKVRWINDRSFLGCANLKTVKIDAAVDHYGDYIFHDCTSLTEFIYCNDSQPVRIRASEPERYKFFTKGSGESYAAQVHVYTPSTFEGDRFKDECDAIKTANVHKYDDAWFTYEGFVLRVNGTGEVSSQRVIESSSDTEKCIKCIDKTHITSAVIESPLSISASVFEGCVNLASVTLPPEITSIPNSAFKGSRLTTFPDAPNVESIGVSAFENTKLTQVSLSQRVSSIADRAFASCSLLTNVSYCGIRDPSSGANQFEGSASVVIHVIKNQNRRYLSDSFCGITGFTEDLDGDACGVPTYQFTHSGEFSESGDFRITDQFSESKDFRSTTQFADTIGFSITNLFSESGDFRITDQFSESKDFRETGQFDETRNFLFTTSFSESGKYSFSQDFLNSYHFSQSKKFSISSQFLDSKEFSTSIHMSLSQIFKETNEFSISTGFSKTNYFAFTYDFSESIRYTISKGFTGSEDLSNSFKFLKTTIFDITTDFTPSKFHSQSLDFKRSEMMSLTYLFSQSSLFKDSIFFSNSNTREIQEESSEIKNNYITSTYQNEETSKADKIHFSSQNAEIDTSKAISKTNTDNNEISATDLSISSLIQNVNVASEEKSSSNSEQETFISSNHVIDLHSSSELNNDNEKNTSPVTSRADDGKTFTSKLSEHESLADHVSSFTNQESIQRTSFETKDRSNEKLSSEDINQIPSSHKDENYKTESSNQIFTSSEIIKRTDQSYEKSIETSEKPHDITVVKETSHFKISKDISEPKIDSNNGHEPSSIPESNEKHVEQSILTTIINNEETSYLKISKEASEHKSEPKIDSNNGHESSSISESNEKHVEQSIMTTIINNEETYQAKEKSSSQQNINIDGSSFNQEDEPKNSIFFNSYQSNAIEQGGGKLKGGQVAGIVVGLILLVIIVLALVYFLVIRRSKKSSVDSSMSFDIETVDETNASIEMVTDNLYSNDKAFATDDNLLTAFGRNPNDPDENDSSYSYVYEEVLFPGI